MNADLDARWALLQHRIASLLQASIRNSESALPRRADYLTAKELELARLTLLPSAADPKVRAQLIKRGERLKLIEPVDDVAPAAPAKAPSVSSENLILIAEVGETVKSLLARLNALPPTPTNLVDYLHKAAAVADTILIRHRVQRHVEAKS